MSKYTLSALVLATLFAGSLGLTACSSNAEKAATAANSQLDDRAKLMRDWRQANESMKAMIENPASFDAAAFKERADFIAKTADTMWPYFEGEANKGGDAKDTVWTDAAGFKAKADEFTAAAAALSAAAANATSAADVEQLYKQMASSCGSCHKEYKN